MSDAQGQYMRLLSSAVENLAQAFHDQYVEKNAKLRSEAGLKTVIVRDSGGKCCDWCADLDGVYTYDDAPKDVFARHANCNCTVSCKISKGTWQDAWNKKEYSNYRESRLDRERELVEKANRKAYTKINISHIASMDGKIFEKIKYNLKKQGVEIIQDIEGDAYLKAMGAEAMTLSDGSAVIFQSDRVPSASAVYEEVIHVSQIRRDGPIIATDNKKSVIEYLQREIDANEKLLKNQKAYKLTDLDIKSVEENLSVYKKKLHKFNHV